MCRTAILYSDSGNSSVSEAIQSSSQVGECRFPRHHPLGTTEFLDLYPEPIDDGVIQVDSKSKDTTGADAEERANQPHDEWLKNDKQIILNWMH